MISINPKKSLRTEIFIYFLLGSLIPALTILFVLTKQLQENLHLEVINRIERGHVVVTTDLYSLLDNFISTVAAQSKEAVIMELVEAGEEARSSLTLLIAHRKRTTLAEVVSIYHLDGSLLASTDRETIKKLDSNFMDRIENKKEEKVPVLLKFSIDKERGLRVDAYAPLVEPFYKYLQGIFQESIFLDKKFIEAIKQKTGLEIGLFNKEKALMYTSSVPPILDSSTFLELINTRKTTTKDTLFMNDKQYHTLLEPILNEDGTVFGAIGLLSSEEHIEQNKKLIQKAFILIFLGIVALSLAISYVSAVRVIKPIQNVVKALRKIAHGDFDQRIKVKNKNEIGDLADSFNFMANDLQKTTVSKFYVDNIINSMLDTLIVVNKDELIQTVNQAVLNLLGYKKKELIGKPVSTIFAKGESLFERMSVGILNKKDFLKKEEKTYLTKDSKIIPVLFSSSVMHGADGGFQGIVCMAQDITDLKKVAAELKESKNRAEAANVAKSVFLANMSHEIRTPISGILGFAQILQRDKDLNIRQNNFVKKIIDCGNHLLEIINDILDIAKIEMGKQELKLIDFDLAELLRRLSAMFKIKCEEKALSWNEEGIGNDPIFVKGDAGKLKQILFNLIGNAVKFTEKGCAGFRFCRKPNNKYFFEIIDTGPGISSEERVQIYTPFVQGKEGRIFGGTGLGLVITKNLIEFMGGNLSLESEVEKGSIFSFSLTLPPSGEPVAPRKREFGEHFVGLAKGCRVKALVTDDNEVGRELLANILSDIGVEVIEAENGQEAFEKTCEHGPDIDIIFMDIRMPIMDGFEASRRIRDSGNKKVKIIITTAAILVQQKEEAISAGCDGFIAKPYRLEGIYGILKKYLDVEYEFDTPESSQKEKKMEIDLASFTIPGNLHERLTKAAELYETSEIKRCLKEIAAFSVENTDLVEYMMELTQALDLNRLTSSLKEIKKI